MFSSSSEYELRVFLSSYHDAIHCLKQSAEKATLRKNYENIANRLTVYVKQKKMFGEINTTNQEQKDILAFQYTHYIFLKYLPDFDNFKGTYEQLQSTLNQAYQSLQQDFQIHSQTQQTQ